APASGFETPVVARPLVGAALLSGAPLVEFDAGPREGAERLEMRGLGGGRGCFALVRLGALGQGAKLRGETLGFGASGRQRFGQALRTFVGAALLDRGRRGAAASLVECRGGRFQGSDGAGTGARQR